MLQGHRPRRQEARRSIVWLDEHRRSLFRWHPSVWIAALVIVLGSGLRLAFYAERHSLWLDEATLALNLQGRNLSELLFETLDYDQAAPLFLLALLKLSVFALGDGEYALRLVPLLFSLVALPLFYIAARRYVGPWPSVLALALVAFSDEVISHAAEVKHYSSDVAVAVALLLSMSTIGSPYSLTARRALGLGLLGAGAIWLSYPSVFILASYGVVAAALFVRHRAWDELVRLILVGASWLASFIVLRSVVFDSVERVQDTFSLGGSGQSEFFMPFPPTSAADLNWFSDAARHLIGESLGVPRYALVFTALFVVLGFINAFRRAPAVAFFLVAPLVFALLASGLEQYPFGARFTVFYAPFAFLLLAEGVFFFGAALGRRLTRYAGRPRVGRSGGLAVAAAVAAILSVAILRPAVDRVAGDAAREDLRPVLEYVQDGWQPGDSIYVFNEAQYALRYYAQCDGCDLRGGGARAGTLWDGLSYTPSDPTQFMPAIESRPPDVVIGVRVNDEIRIRTDFAALTGESRVWIIGSHIRSPETRGRYRKTLAHLESVGVRRDEYFASGAEAFLYDLNTS